MKAVVYLIAYPFLAVYRGFALSLLWGWFAVPAFGLPALRVVDAIGVSLIVGFLTHHYSEDDKSVAWLIAYSLVSTTMALAFGFVWQLFR